MLIKRKRTPVSGINATSVSDISFMLLSFFLVISSMDTNKGLLQQLPPEDSKRHPQETLVNKDDLMAFVIDKDDKLYMNKKPIAFEQVRDEVRKFILSKGTKHMISIEVSPQTNYNAYFLLQNEIAMAYNKLRNAIAIRKYGCSYKRCNKEQKEDIRKICPQKVTEIYSGKEDEHAHI
ncbi:MAG: ExbD/TolR family protein [Prevotella sp.]